MFQRVLTAVAVAGVLALGACYDFENPVDPPPGRPLDPALMGTWRCLKTADDADAEPANFVFGTARDRVYSIRFEVKGEETTFYEAHASDVKGHALLNVREVAPKEPVTRPWTLARYSFLRPDVLQVQLVDDSVLKDPGQGSAGMRAALERLEGTPGLYGDFVVCVRATNDKKKVE